MLPWTTRYRALFALSGLCILFLPSCGTISTYQTGKTIPKGKISFGMATSAGLFRTKSHIVGFPLELAYGAADFFGGYGLFEFLDVNLKAVAGPMINADEGSKSLNRYLKGAPILGGASARMALAQERWGFPLSIAVGSGYYTGAIQQRRTDLEDVETHRQLTETTDRVLFINVSRDVFSWLTLYGAYKWYNRLSHNRTWVYRQLVDQEAINDKLEGYGSGISFNVGQERNTYIMLEIDAIEDTDEPARHYQKQAGLGMSVEF